MNRLSRICCVAAAGLAVVCAVAPLALGQPAFGQPRSALAARTFRVPLAQSTNRLIVKLKAGVDSAVAPSPINPRFMAMTAERAAALSVAAGVQLTPFRVMSGDAHVLSLGRNMSNDEAAQIAGRVARDPTVQYAEADTRRFPMQAAASDPYYGPQQWYLWGSGVSGGVANFGLNVEPVWQAAGNTQGQGVVVAVIDTGILPHPDLITPPSGGSSALGLGTLGSSLGYDFITDVPTANDGNARDSDPTDPGDWVLASESSNTMSPFSGCPVQDSDWHGTHSAGLIAARANNKIGIAGVAYNANIVPLRVLGKCGGFLSDIADAIQWAAGAPSSVSPPIGAISPNQKAQVLNLSLGAFGTCSATEQNAINAAVTAGALAIVVAAGNGDGSDVSQFTPASCAGVIAVASTDRNGSLTSYTNVGGVGSVSVSAPGGFFTSASDVGNAILSDWEPGANCSGGTTAIPFGSNMNPACSDAGDLTYALDFAYFYGTSESTALVSGVSALMIAAAQANGKLGALNVKAFLEGSAGPFGDCSCTTTTCGKGIVDADTAVRSAASGAPVANTAPRPSCPATGQLSGTVFIDANRNGVRDAGEVGLANAPVVLTTNNIALIAETTTDANGAFTFAGVRPLAYDMGAVAPAGTSYTMSGAVVGSLGGTAAPLVDPASGITVAGGFVGVPMTAGATGSGYVIAAVPPAPPPSSSGGGGGGCTLAGVESDFDLVFPLCLLAASAGVLVRRRRVALQRARTRLHP